MKRKSKRKKVNKPIVPLPPEKRKLPTYKDNHGKVMTGDFLFQWICQDYKSKHGKEFYDATLPFDYLEKVKEHVNTINHTSYSAVKYKTNNEYKEYINSPVWRALRKRILGSRNSCEICGVSDCELQLHHLSYANFKHELDKDMLVVCESCHKEIHKEKLGALL